MTTKKSIEDNGAASGLGFGILCSRKGLPAIVRFPSDRLGTKREPGLLSRLTPHIRRLSRHFPGPVLSPPRMLALFGSRIPLPARSL